MYVSCSCLVCDRERYPTVEDALRQIAELGFGAFDLDVFENWQHINPSALAEHVDEWKWRLANATDETGLKVSSFNCGLSQKPGSPDPAAFEQYAREFSALLELAEALGCPNITLQPGPVLAEHSPDEQLAAMREHLAELAPIKGDRELTISIEGHAHTLLEEPSVALDVVRDLWPGVGFTYDPSHPELLGFPLTDMAALVEYTCHVHVRNASRGQMQATMEDGTVDFQWLVAALRDHGYDGALSIEYFGGFDAEFASVTALRDRLVELGVAAQPG
ncbi:MAG: sugar phosphate isomerase/epimerase family protein [Armatimonadota bacterium]|jgi:sugar phosphate isomerase/epimerase